MSAHALTKAIRSHAAKHAADASDDIQLGEFTSISPLVLSLLGSNITLDADEINLAQAVASYHAADVIDPGDTAVVVRKRTGGEIHWLVVAIIADKTPTAPGGGGGGGGAPTGPAGGVLSGTYPNPGFALDMATQTELDAEASARVAADGVESAARIAADALKADLTDTRFPTANEKAALAGTSGAPSVTNKYVTDADQRIKNQRAFAMAVS